MANKLLIVMVNANPASGPELAAPLSQATAAASMEYDVEVVLDGMAGRLALKDVAAAVRVREAGERNVYDMIREAHAAGAVFKVTAAVVDCWGEDFIPEINGVVGGAYIVSEAMDDETVTFTY